MSSAHVPVTVQVAMAHAWLQFHASSLGVDLLHLKGPAIDEAASRPDRTSTDADLIVRPSRLDALLDLLDREGWTPMDHFATSSSFEHSAAFMHPAWGLIDVHRRYPGFSIPPERAFDVLWRDRHPRDIAGIPCDVPSLEAQILVILLHAARSAGGRRATHDIEMSWGRADSEQRARVEALATELGAEFPLAIALGRDLSPFAHLPEYDLWMVASRGGTRIDEWRARIKAAPTRHEALRVALRAPLVNRDNLAVRLGHPPTSHEVVAEFFSRLWRGVSMEWSSRHRS